MRPGNAISGPVIAYAQLTVGSVQEKKAAIGPTVLRLPDKWAYFEVRPLFSYRGLQVLSVLAQARKAVSRMDTLERRNDQVKGIFGRVEEIEEIAEELADREPAAVAKLQRVAGSAVASAGPVPLSVAAELLQLSVRTVATWADQGVLEIVARRPKRVDPVQLYKVKHLVEELRAAGRNRDLVTAVWHRLQDQAVLERDDLAESLEQFRRGKKIPI